MAQATLAAVSVRGHVLCGVAGNLRGFSAASANGSMRGKDAEYCQALAAAALGVTSAKMAQSVQANDPKMLARMGIDAWLAQAAGVAPEWALRAVGNYHAVFERNMSAAWGIGLDRGPNDLWCSGGLHFPQPLR